MDESVQFLGGGVISDSEDDCEEESRFIYLFTFIFFLRWSLVDGPLVLCLFHQSVMSRALQFHSCVTSTSQ